MLLYWSVIKAIKDHKKFYFEFFYLHFYFAVKLTFSVWYVEMVSWATQFKIQFTFEIFLKSLFVCVGKSLVVCLCVCVSFYLVSSVLLLLQLHNYTTRKFHNCACVCICGSVCVKVNNDEDERAKVKARCGWGVA